MSETHLFDEAEERSMDENLQLNLGRRQLLYERRGSLIEAHRVDTKATLTLTTLTSYDPTYTGNKGTLPLSGRVMGANGLHFHFGTERLVCRAMFGPSVLRLQCAPPFDL